MVAAATDGATDGGDGGNGDGHGGGGAEVGGWWLVVGELGSMSHITVNIFVW